MIKEWLAAVGFVSIILFTLSWLSERRDMKLAMKEANERRDARLKQYVERNKQ